MNKAVFLIEPGKMTYEPISKYPTYVPPAAEQEKHGVTMILDHTEREPGPGEVLVRVLASGICTHETSLFKGELTSPFYPMIPGHESVCRVLAVGEGVTHLKAGDFASCCFYMGQWADVMCGPASLSYRLPDGIEDPAMWIIEPSASIVNAVNLMEIHPADRVLVIGAGYMGQLMISLLSRYPLARLSVLEYKEALCDIAKEMGADEAVSPASERGMKILAEEDAFDMVVEISGSQAGLDNAMRLVRTGGQINVFAWHRQPRMVDLRAGHIKGIRINNTSPGMDVGRIYERHWPKTIALFEKGVFDHTRLISHRFAAEDAQQAMEVSAKRPEEYIKGALIFE